MNKYFIQNTVMAALLSGTFMVPTAFAKGNDHSWDSSHQTIIQQTQQQTGEQEQQQTEGQAHVFGQSEDHHGNHSEIYLYANSNSNSNSNSDQESNQDSGQNSNQNSNITNQSQHKQEVQALHTEIAKLHQIQQQERSVHKQLNADIHSLFARMQSDVQTGNTADLSSLSSGLTTLASNLQQAVQDGSTANQDVNQAQVQAKSTTGIQNAIAQIQKVEALKLQKIAAMQKAIQGINALLSTTSVNNSSTGTSTNSPSNDVSGTNTTNGTSPTGN